MRENAALVLTVTVLTLLFLVLGIRFVVLVVRARRRADRAERREPDLLFDALEEQTRREREARAKGDETAQALRALDVLHRTVMRHLPVGVLVLGEEGLVRLANPWLVAAFGAEQVIGRPVASFSPALADCVASIEHEAELELILEGRTRHLRVNRSAMEEGVLVTVVDETRLRRLEERVRAKRDLELMGELAGGVTHEVKNTLATLAGMVQLLSYSEVTDLEPKLLAEIDRLDRFVREFTSTSKAGRPNREQLALGVWLEAQADHWRAWPHGDKVTVGAADATLEADPVMLAMVLDNLVRNGIEACQGDDPPTPWVEVRVHERPDQLEIRVEDAGPGFAALVRDRLFTPFVTTKSDGTGLGLFQCRKVMLEHGGALEVTHGPPTRVSLVFPRDMGT